MADSVQYALDRMVVDLEDLRYRGIFSESEIRTIVVRRREFEYMLRRHESRKLDYMRYVEHELNLESLRALRTKRLGGNRGGKKGKKKKAGAASDFSCVRLIRWIFDRAVVKFPADVDLWLHYIEFAVRQGQSKTLGRLCARALQLHPRNAGLWIKAASWEFFDGGNASSARALMQRGLRINPGAQNLWLQYFRLEFCYIEKLRGRREVLGLDDEGDDGASGGGGDAMDIPPLDGEGQQGGPSFNAVKKATATAALPGSSGGRRADSGGSNASRPAPEMNDTARRFYSGAVPLAVFRAAVKAVPGDVEFRAGFLRCCALDFPTLGGEVAQAVVTSIAQDFPARCDAWELRALYPLLVAEGKGVELLDAAAGGGGVESGERGHASAAVLLAPVVQECVDVFERAVTAVGDREPDMWVRYASFLQGRLEAEGGQVTRKRKGDQGLNHDARGSARGAGAVALRLQDVLSRAVEVHMSTPTSDSGTNGEKKGAAEGKTIDLGRHGASSVIAGAGGAPSGEDDAAAVERRADDAREALSAGLSDVHLALGKPSAALAALRAATDSLPRRAGPWLRRAALERRMGALGVGVGGAHGASSIDTVEAGGSRGVDMKHRGAASSDIAVQNCQSDVAIGTLREGTETVPSAARGYPQLWRELLASSIAAGVGKKTLAAAFRRAVEACNPSGGGDQGLAQGEFLAGYLRWSGAVEGPAAARRALQWARRSFLLAGAGAAVAYNEAIELERNLAGEGRAKFVRNLFEDAADRFGKQMPGIWQEYAQFEIQEGDIKRANAVRWRSQQVLGGAVSGGKGGIQKGQRKTLK